MKKIVSISIVLLLIAALAMPAFAQDKQYCVDNCGFLQDEEVAEVENRLKTLSDQLNMDIVVVTTDDLEGKSLRDYADDYYDYKDYGKGRRDDRSGVLLLVHRKNGGDTERWISTRGYGITAFTDYGIQYVGEQLKPLMEEGKWKESFMRYAELAEDLVTRANDGKPLDKGSERHVFLGIIVVLAAAIICASLAAGAVKKKYKPVTFKPNATDYLVNGSLNLTGSADNFRTTSVSRVLIERDSGGGSSTHTSSSGASHGGGGF